MVDYALINQCLYEGKAKEVEQMTIDALAQGPRRAANPERRFDRGHERGG